MNHLKRLALTITLAVVLAGTAVGGELNTPPCTNDPGELNTPPCSSSQLLTDAPDTGQANVPVASDLESLAFAAAVSVIENILTVY